MEKSYNLLSINRSKGSKLIGPFIKVPNKIDGYKDILYTLNQLEINEQGYQRLKRFNLNLDEIKKIKPLLFAYLLGFLVGDFGKKEEKRKYGITRRFSLMLTQAYPQNEGVGEFASLCVNSINLRMNRIKDCMPGKMNKYPFFRWNGQLSSIAQWIFNVCLGLKDNQLTTYDAIKAEWILKTPKAFKIWFIQGLADSDGFIDIGTLQVGIITTPNTKLIKKLFEDLGIHTNIKKYDYNTLEAIMISIREFPKIQIFNKYAKGHRYELFQKLVNAKRMSHHLPKEIGEEVNKYIKRGVPLYKIGKIILNKYNIAIRRTSIMKRKRRLLK